MNKKHKELKQEQQDKQSCYNDVAEEKQAYLHYITLIIDN